RSASKAATAELMSWMPVSRLVAVTTISSSSSSSSSDEDWDCAGMAATQAMANATLARTVIRDGFTVYSSANCCNDNDSSPSLDTMTQTDASGFWRGQRGLSWCVPSTTCFRSCSTQGTGSCSSVAISVILRGRTTHG